MNTILSLKKKSKRFCSFSTAWKSLKVDIGSYNNYLKTDFFFHCVRVLGSSLLNSISDDPVPVLHATHYPRFSIIYVTTLLLVTFDLSRKSPSTCSRLLEKDLALICVIFLSDDTSGLHAIMAGRTLSEHQAEKLLEGVSMINSILNTHGTSARSASVQQQVQLDG